jgi:hypothetical protein
MPSLAHPHRPADRSPTDRSPGDRSQTHRPAAIAPPARWLAGGTAAGMAAFVAGIALAFATARGVPAAVTAAPAGPSGAAQAPGSPLATKVHLPVLSNVGGTGGGSGGCPSAINVVSLGPGATKAILVLWEQPELGGASCQAPSRVVCSGLLRPGSAWDFGLDSTPDFARSGVLYSFTAQRLSEIGVSIGGDDVVADYVCDQLRATVAGDCGAYATFAAAYTGGDTHFGVPLDRAAGSPLVAEVYRSCPGDVTPRLVVTNLTSLYNGIGANALGRFDAAFGAYRYLAAPIHADDRGLNSILYAQNAGDKTTSVELWFQATGACDGGQLCRTIEIDPGASAFVSAADCVGPDWNGTVRLRSSGPLAVAVDTQSRDTLATFTAVAPTVATDPTGAAPFTPTSHAAYGPLTYATEHGWDIEVTVQNLSLTAGADVEVTFLDAGGATVATQPGRVCAQGSATFLLPVAGDLPESRAGSLRVVSHVPGGIPAAEPAPISAVATLRKYTDAVRTATDETLAYNLVPESTAFAWPAGAGTGGTASGSAIVVVPAWLKDLNSDASVTMEMAISNLVPVAGWTDVAVLVYDQNDLVDVLCRHLGAGQTTYIDLQTMGLVPPGFRGSAVVSATYWEHPVPADGAGPARQLVGLGAVALWRTGSRLRENIPGDEIAGAIGIPLATWPDAAGLPPDPCGTAPVPGWKPAPGGLWQSVVPVLFDKAGYTTELTLRNEGDEPTSVRLHYRANGQCNRDRVCTLGVLAAGATVRVSATKCPPVWPGWEGSVALHSREPLAVSAEANGNGPPISTVGRAGRYPFDVNSDGAVDGADRQAVAAARGSASGDPGWNPRADLDANGRVDLADQLRMDENLCGADRPPETPGLGLPQPRGDTALLPVLRFKGDDPMCLASVTAQDIGSAPTKALLVMWPGPTMVGCSGPIAVACSGLIRPGGAWQFPQAVLPSGAKSGILFSFNDRPLSEIGASVGGDEPVADYLCRVLAGTLVGDCAAYDRFKAAFDTGADYAGVPLDKAAGSTLTADVRRDCPADVSPGVDVTASYTAVGTHQLGAADVALGGYLMYVPLVIGAKAGLNTVIYAQNAGAQTATVELWFQAQDDCSGERLCQTLTIGTGETVSIDPVSSRMNCVSRDSQWQGNAWLKSDQPLAAVTDIFGRDILLTYRAVAPNVAFDANGVPLPTGGRTMAYGPLYFGQETGWDVSIQVQNLSRTRPAQVRVEFLDARGAQVQVLDDLICPAGTQTLFLPVSNVLPGLQVGSVRVVSQRFEGDPSGEPAPIAAMAMALRYSDPNRTTTIDGATFDLLSEREALARSPGAAGGTTTGIGAVALSGVVTASGGGDATSELAISNFVSAPGWTEVAVLFFDANGLVDLACRRIDASAVDYLSLAGLPLPAGFRGGAIVSATQWQHPIGGTGRGPLRNLVGLGAAVVTRRISTAGDELAAITGLPLANVSTAIGGDAVARCAALPTATPSATRPTPVPTVSATRTPTVPVTRTPTPTASPGGAATVFLPYVLAR